MLEGTNSSARGRLGTSMGPDGLSYGGAGEGVTMAVSSQRLPFPVNLRWRAWRSTSPCR